MRSYYDQQQQQMPVGGFSNQGGNQRNQEIQFQTRIAILETREKQLNRKLETAMTILGNTNQSQVKLQKEYDELDKRWSELTE
jgi:hypothetical protein